MTAAGLSRAIAAAIDARVRLRRRATADTIASLAAAAARWASDAELAATLAEPSRLDPTMVRHVLPLVAGMLDRDAMLALVEREGGDGESDAEWMACVLASNVPALAIPAIALACLAGSAVVVKSGHRDRLSAAVFQRALAAVDPPLAATVVPVSWPHDAGLDDVLLDAPLAVLSGHDGTVAALAARATGRVLGYGARHSALVLDAAAPIDYGAIALDVVRYEQRGCLSPHVCWVVGDAAAVASGVTAALATLAETLPPAATTVDERATVRAFLDDAAWSGARVEAGPWGAVVLEAGPAFRPTCGFRTLRVMSLASAETLPGLLPEHGIECIGTNVPPPAGLRSRGVARVCPIGRMQQPPLSWPRGQRPALASLLRDTRTAQMAVER